MAPSHLEQLRALLRAADPCVMGIINATPDSFSGDGTLQHADPVQAALEQAKRMAAKGAAILDVGGESTRPGSIPVTAAEETQRVVPVIKAVRAAFPDLPISIDTTKASVAEAALKAGASMVNDVSGLLQDARMADVVNAADVPIIVMHNRAKQNAFMTDEKIGGSYVAHTYKDFSSQFLEEMKILKAQALAHITEVSNIILDPGIGFGKTVEQNIEIIEHCTRLVQLGPPILIGASRKSFIGKLLNVPPQERVATSVAYAAKAAKQGVKILRVHDVKETVKGIQDSGFGIQHSEDASES